MFSDENFEILKQIVAIFQINDLWPIIHFKA